jgi:hypothetical protein
MSNVVTGEVDPKTGVPVITLTYGADLILKGGSDLEKDLVQEYENLSKSKDAKSKSLVLNFQSDIAGSPVVRALIKMHSFLSRGQKGQLLVANYPADFLPALQALGVTTLPGFRLVSNRDVGVELASRASAAT